MLTGCRAEVSTASTDGFSGGRWEVEGEIRVWVCGSFSAIRRVSSVLLSLNRSSQVVIHSIIHIVAVPCGEFYGQSSAKDWDVCGSSETFDLLNSQNKPVEILKLLQGPLEQGLTIIYVPTRKETFSIAKFLCQFGVRAAAYNAKLPKSHLRQVHKEFHENALECQKYVATDLLWWRGLAHILEEKGFIKEGEKKCL
ncbi:hypothetical protein F0562_019960 [Nyssa sinensis]|uniref:Uncharacterized protein n=1 Tax=Nyssa sinensis TaxID=561372 RepID=A0A5J5BV52_9ASTE|nr:hypothetical protein F0562_019960 [Nyssa sinensis]